MNRSGVLSLSKGARSVPRAGARPSRKNLGKKCAEGEKILDNGWRGGVEEEVKDKSPSSWRGSQQPGYCGDEIYPDPARTVPDPCGNCHGQARGVIPLFDCSTKKPESAPWRDLGLTVSGGSRSSRKTTSPERPDKYPTDLPGRRTPWTERTGGEPVDTATISSAEPVGRSGLGFYGFGWCRARRGTNPRKAR
jgi:hypothetical protein